jgi:UPF0148 protein
MREMAEMLHKGAKMLNISCPECGNPLFQMKNSEVICPRCKREVRILKEGEDATRVAQNDSLEKTIARKLNIVQRQLEATQDAEHIRELTETLIILLDALHRLKNEKN